jgi:hypothetical protein
MNVFEARISSPAFLLLKAANPSYFVAVYTWKDPVVYYEKDFNQCCAFDTDRGAAFTL